MLQTGFAFFLEQRAYSLIAVEHRIAVSGVLALLAFVESQTPLIVALPPPEPALRSVLLLVAPLTGILHLEEDVRHARDSRAGGDHPVLVFCFHRREAVLRAVRLFTEALSSSGPTAAADP